MLDKLLRIDLTVEELILKLCKEFDRVDPDMLRSCAVLVNNEYVMDKDRGKRNRKMEMTYCF